MSKKWYIGIDFGTSNTYITAYEANAGIIYTNQHLRLPTDHNHNIPTLIVQDAVLNTAHQLTEQIFYIGEEANLHPILRPFKGLKNAARELTPNNGMFGNSAMKFPFEQCGLDSTIDMGNDDYPLICKVRDTLVHFFKKILHIGDEEFDINEKTVQKIVIGQPVVNGRTESLDGTKVSYEKTLKSLLSECFTGDKSNKKFIGDNGKDGIITVIEEPELAGVTYLFTESARSDKKVLVIDIGGGTSDFSVLEYKDGNVRANNIGSCEIAGNAIDKMIFDFLPDSVPRSRALCKDRKEHLFRKPNADTSSNKIVPRTNNELMNLDSTIVFDSITQFNLHYGKKTSKNCLVLSTGELFQEDKLVQNDKAKITNVFNDIGVALKKALDDNKITGINTVFFVGGTSIITPLRETLINIITNMELPYCAAGFDVSRDVITMFGDNTKTIKADMGSPLTVTCYNAVAIGACIKAMGNKLCIKPKVEYKPFYAWLDSEHKFYSASSSELIIITKRGVPFMYAIHDINEVSEWKKNNKFYNHDYEEMEFISNDKFDVVYKMNATDFLNLKRGLLIVLKLNEDGIECEAYDCVATVSGITDKGLDHFIKDLQAIKMEKIDKELN